MNNFKIITTVYNAEKYIEKCINSVISQEYTNWEMLIIDDKSTDNTYEIVKKKIKGNDKIQAITNTENKKAIFNYVNYIPEFCKDDEDIIVSLDGDDWLYDDTVIVHLNKVYNNGNINVTYGSYITTAEMTRKNLAKDCNNPIKSIDDMKNYGFNLSHLKTWKYKIWRKINSENLKRWDGKYIQSAWDTPIMINLLRNCSIDTVRYIKRLMYVYNVGNTISEYKIRGNIQKKENKYIRDKLL